MESFDMHPQNAVAKDVAEITRRALLTYAPHHKGSFNTAEFMQKLKSVSKINQNVIWYNSFLVNMF